MRKAGCAGLVDHTGALPHRVNDYSASTSYGFQEVTVKDFVDEVVILGGCEKIAQHQRSDGSGTRP
ncbi:MAG: hypothetical protein BGP05_04955 [Rhizobiales bacterium 62-47]|nr:hypothetical protein [Hyphomicrobiales bacterium]OJY09091.1 MAG: hypothetical protein BGP05_04955 [Rhizobiales bacterium 62-47]WIG53894.1 MAG: hypothetical protein OJF48_004815 [Afipia sp.]